VSGEIGVSAVTLNSWLSILEASYIVFRLPPYYRNLGKRLVKSPKLYFYRSWSCCLSAGNPERKSGRAASAIRKSV